MNRQTLQAKESAPAKKKSSFSWLRPAAAHPAAETEHEAPSASSPAFAHDFTKVPVRPMQLPGVPGFSCPFAPQRCPSGGACHTCPPKIQAKLKIGQPGDQYEQEADRVAETVMRMPEPQVQRKGCSATGCKDEDEDKLVQTKSAGSAGNAQVDHPLIQSVLSSPGQPLDAGTRSFMEPRFGQDFSGVRVHVGGQAAESARAVNARAYTVGRDVVFGEGQYAPGSDEGRRLVAHELVHVGQQLGVFRYSKSMSRFSRTDLLPIIQRQDDGSGVHGTKETGIGDRLSKQGWYRVADAAESLGMTNAARHMRHYLNNTGAVLNVNVDQMSRDLPGLQARFQTGINTAKALANSRIAAGDNTQVMNFAFSGQPLNYYAEKSESSDWFYAIGGFTYWYTAEVQVIPSSAPDGNPTVNMIITFHVFDRYNWDKGKSVNIGSFTVSDASLGELHKAGIAKEYEVNGASSPIDISWEWRHIAEPPSAQAPPVASNRDGTRTDIRRDRSSDRRQDRELRDTPNRSSR